MKGKAKALTRPSRIEFTNNFNNIISSKVSSDTNELELASNDLLIYKTTKTSRDFITKQ